MILIRNSDFFGMCFVGALLGTLYSITCATIILRIHSVVILSYLVLVFLFLLFVYTYTIISRRERTIILRCPFCKKEAKFREKKLVKMFKE